ncbi:MAG TPA: hypothetical protein VHN11_21085 [Xanthobacteraceae bacterium]|jgi:hypothetical protein|nr:hypothetical protein [Xanthobacteraceae bacterium]
MLDDVGLTAVRIAREFLDTPNRVGAQAAAEWFFCSAHVGSDAGMYSTLQTNSDGPSAFF